ncbi:hypothetical protein BKP56_08935 [Marinilactibacillus sp. 15R]|nr:hypothetical protein BKP56_08935 [Marinilactibacillus sp. 15R]
MKKFSDDNVTGEFSLRWNEHNLEGTIQTLKSINRYDEEKVKMMLDEEESFIEQIKKDESNDGVERI